MKRLISYLIFLLIFIPGHNSCAEEFKLKNGEIIRGTVVGETESKYIVQVKFGKIEIIKSDLALNPPENSSKNFYELSGREKFNPGFSNPLFLKKLNIYIKNYLTNYRDESVLLISGLMILFFSLITGRFLIPFILYGLFGWFFYFHLTADDRKDIQVYCQIMHNETHAMCEFCDKEHQALKYTEFNLVAAQQIKLMYLRIRERIKVFEDRINKFKIPRIFKKTHNKYNILTDKVKESIEKYIELLGPVKIKELQALYEGVKKYIDEEKVLLKEFEDTAKKYGFEYHKNCSCHLKK